MALTSLLSKLALALATVTAGVGGVWLLFWLGSWLVERLPTRSRQKVLPWIFLGPALLLLAGYLVYPVFQTALTSVTEDVLPFERIVPERYGTAPDIASHLVADQEQATFQGYVLRLGGIELARASIRGHPVLILIRPETITDPAGGEPRRVFTVTGFGWENYAFAFTNPDMKVAFSNNILWLVLGTGASVVLGLLIAALVDRVRYESAAKSLIFAPLAISFVGASVIWKFMYAWQPAGRQQIGLLNAIVTGLGGDPVPVLIDPPGNTLALIVIMVWLQTGFCMIVLSAALKGIPLEILEAARIDGANDIQLFLRITVPMIQGSILTVATTVFIAVLKVFDIVYVMTGGRFDTEVIANRMFIEMFTFRNFGRASALAAILLLVVTPIMVINVRNLRRQGIAR